MTTGSVEPALQPAIEAFSSSLTIARLDVQTHPLKTVFSIKYVNIRKRR